MPIGAVQTASGYDVAWKIPGANHYTFWTTDSNGNYIRPIPAVSGTSYCLESLRDDFRSGLQRRRSDRASHGDPDRH